MTLYYLEGQEAYSPLARPISPDLFADFILFAWRTRNDPVRPLPRRLPMFREPPMPVTPSYRRPARVQARIDRLAAQGGLPLFVGESIVTVSDLGMPVRDKKDTRPSRRPASLESLF